MRRSAADSARRAAGRTPSGPVRRGAAVTAAPSQAFLDLPGRKQAQLALAYDYKSNVAAYPAWQEWLREHRPPTLITWGVNDPFFPEPGARAYLRDVPDAELHLFETGHFALEDHLPRIAPLIADFLDRD